MVIPLRPCMTVEYTLPPPHPHLLLHAREKLNHIIHTVQPVVELLRRVLREMRDPQVGVTSHFAPERSQLVEDEVEQGGLARTVGPHDPDARVEVHPEVDVGEEGVGRVVAERYSLDLPPLWTPPTDQEKAKKKERRRRRTETESKNNSSVTYLVPNSI